MAGQGRKTFSDGEVLSAADVNGYLMDQSVMRFADSTARTAAIGTPTEGMVSYLDDTNDVEVYDGSGWVNFTGDITNITAGTGLSGGGSEGAVTLSADFTTVQENLITTEGDLYIGDSNGDSSRLGIGAADTVLTSNGTTAVWVASAGGGGENFVGLPYNVISTIDVSFPADHLVRFAVATTSTAAFSLILLDSSGNTVEEVSVDRDNPFSYFTNATPVAQIKCLQDVVNEEVVLIFSDPNATTDPDSVSGTITTVFSTQSVTLANNADVFVFGGGGGGGGSRNSAGGGGGGAGFLATGSISAGTYTATIGGAGSAGNFNGGAGGSGGTSSISTVSANGGSGGAGAPGTSLGGNGGNGGSGGGGGGGSSTSTAALGGIGGADGSAGNAGESVGSGSGGSAGTGSGTASSTTDVQIVQPAGDGGEQNETSSFDSRVRAGFYAGGGGGVGRGLNNRNGLNASGRAGGGNGGQATTNEANGGTGAAGFIMIREVA